MFCGLLMKYCGFAKRRLMALEKDYMANMIFLKKLAVFSDIIFTYFISCGYWQLSPK